MKLARILAAVAVAGLGTATVIPLLTRSERVAGMDDMCREQYRKAAAINPHLPTIDPLKIHYYTALSGGRRESCSGQGFSWDPANNAMSLYR